MFKNPRLRGFAPVVPIKLLHKMHFEHGCAGGYHLPLAHDVLAHKEEYLNVFEGIYKQFNSDRTIIMDNSVIETGGSPDCKGLIEACEITRATHLVLPDVLENAVETLHATRKAYHEFPWGDYYRVSFAVVPQGKTFRDWIWCAEALAKEIDFDMWCVPRNFEERLGTRWDACKILQMISPKKIHLLGFSDYIWADMYAAQHPSVVGIDSAVPIRVGMEGELLQLNALYKSRGNWWDTINEDTKIHQMVFRNLKKTNLWINGEY